MKRHQAGSAHIFVIIVLIILLFAALGVVFYQNFVAKPTSSSTETTKTNMSDTKATVRTAFNSGIYALDYPKGWTATAKEDGDPQKGSTITLANKNKTIQVNLAVNQAPLSTACNTSDGLSISYYKVYPTSVTKLADDTLYTVEAMYDHPGGGYDYVIGLTPDGGDTHAAVGDTHCNVIQVGQAANVLAGADGKLQHPTVTATITLPKVTAKAGQAVPEMQVVRDILKTDDYKAAVAILESARKE